MRNWFEVSLIIEIQLNLILLTARKANNPYGIPRLMSMVGVERWSR